MANQENGIIVNLALQGNNEAAKATANEIIALENEASEGVKMGFIYSTGGGFLSIVDLINFQSDVLHYMFLLAAGGMFMSGVGRYVESFHSQSRANARLTALGSYILPKGPTLGS